MRLEPGQIGLEAMNTGSWEAKKRIPMFRIKGLYPMFLRRDGHCRGIILPPFDPTLSINDESRKTSWAPYRCDEEDPETGDRKIILGYAVRGYRYYGANKSTFVSPKTCGFDDPIVDIYEYLKSQRNNGIITDDVFKSYTKSNKDGLCLIPNLGALLMLNVWAAPTNEYAKDKSEKNQVLVLSIQAANKLISDLNTPRPSVMKLTDPDWPVYQYGDPSNPAHAIRFSQVLYTPNGQGGFPGPAINFGNTRIRGNEIVLDTEYTTITKEMLEGRYDLGDLDNVVYIPTYNEIVDQLLEEQLVPYDLIAKVCADKYEGSFPNKGSKTSTSSAPSGFTASAPYEASKSNPLDELDQLPGLETPVPTAGSAAQVAATPVPTAGSAAQVAATPIAQSQPTEDAELKEYKELDARIRSGNCTNTEEFERYRTLRVKFGALN